MKILKCGFCTGVAMMAAIIFQHSARAQGSLTPPGAPGATMKTLDQVEARTPISSLPYVITNMGSYYLTGTLYATGSNQFGIVIQTNNVSLDLNGFGVIGRTNTRSGIYISGSYYGITIRNGSVSGWDQNGVDGYIGGFPRDVVYEDLKVWGNKVYGLETEEMSTVRNCMAYNNGASGFYSAGGLFVDCVSRENGIYGFLVGFSKLRSCYSQYNPTGIYVNHSTVEDCDISNNTTNGVELLGACQLINNRIADNTNPSFGYAILVDGGQNSIIGNMVVNNTFGLVANAAGATNNCIVQNRFIASSSTVVSSKNMFPTAEISVSAGANFGSTNSLINIIYP